jgi:NADH-quinone oxidoreductase subunit G
MIHIADRPEAGHWKLCEDITKALSESYAVFKPIIGITPHAAFRTAGMKIPRQPHRYSGRTSMHAHISMHEPKPPDDPDSPLSFSMEGYKGMPPSSLIPRFWSPGWNSVQSVNKFQNETGGPLRGGDPGRRLLEPHSGRDIVYFHDVPEAFHLQPGELLVIPLYHIFGSEELSRLSGGITELMPQTYLGINPHDMKYLEIPEGAEVEIMIRETAFGIRAKRIETLPKGILGLPVGLPGLQVVVLPAYAKNLLVKMSGAMQ